MAKFNFKAELDSAKNDVHSKKIETGFYRVIITQVAEIGYQKAFNPEDEPQLKVGVVFENAVGQQICKIMQLKISSYSHFGQLCLLFDDIESTADLLGKELFIEVEGNANWPKITCFYSLDDGMTLEPKISTQSELFYFTIDEPNADCLKKLHADLKKAISTRIRVKGDENASISG